MQNYETYKEMMTSFGQGDQIGSAMAENAKYIDSISGKLAQLKATWTDIATTVFNSSMIKGALDTFNSLSEVIAKVVHTIDDLNLGFPATVASFLTLKSLFSSIKNSGGILSGFLNFGDGIANLINSASGLERVSSATSSIGKVALESADDMVELAGATASASKSSGGLIATLKGLSTFSIVSAGIVAGMVALYAVAKNVSEQARENYLDLQNQISETQQEISNLGTAKTNLQPLVKEYDELKGKAKLSNEELARFKELNNQIAQISPELVIGYDENGDAILALNGTLEEYINNLDTAIARKQELLKSQQNSAGTEAGKDIYKYDTSGYNAYNDLKQLDLNSAFEMNWTGTQLKDFETLCENYVKIVQKRNDRIAEVNTDLATKYEQFSEYELAIQQKAFNNLSDASKYKEFNSLSESASASMDRLVATFNWGTQGIADNVVEQQKFYKGFNEISKEIGQLGEDGSAKVDAWNKKLEEANYAYQQTGDIDQYRESIQGVCEELETLTGIDAGEWARGFTQQLTGSLDDSQMALNDFLKNYGKSIEDLNSGDEYAIKLKAEWEANTDFLNEIMTMDSIESAIDWVVKLNKGEIDYEGLSPQIRGLAQGLLDGSDTMTEQEFTTMMSIVAQIQQHGDLSAESWALVEKMMNGTLTDEEIEMGITLPDGTKLDKDLVELINRINAGKDHNVEVGVKVIDKELEKDLNSILNGKEEQEVKINIITALENNNLGQVKEELAQLPTEKQIQIIESIIEHGDYTVYEMSQILNGLPPEVQLAVYQTISQSGDLTQDELMALYNLLPPEVRKYIQVSTNGGETNVVLEETNELSEDKNKSVNTTAPGAQQTNSILKQINQKTYNKNQTVTTKDNGGSSTLSTLKGIANAVKNRVQTITTKFVQIGSQIWNGLNGGNGNRSVGDFSGISETPNEISAQSEGFSDISSAPSENSGFFAKVSSKAINTIQTGVGYDSKISTSYNKVWNSIKNGINLFQELENRIKKVQNNLSLLDVKMENAVGTKKIGYLQQQIQLMQQEAKLQEKLYSKQTKAQSQLAKKVEQYGFNVTKDGNVVNYEETLRKLESQAEQAEKYAESIQDKMSGSSSNKSESQKKWEESVLKNAEKQAEKTKDTLSDAKKAVEQYLDYQYSEIPKVQQEWQELQNSIKAAKDELEQLKFESKYKKEDHAIGELNSKYEQYTYYLERARTHKENLVGTAQIDAIKDEIKQTQRLIEVQKKLNTQYSSKKGDYRSQLRKYGAEFDSNGQVKNYQSFLNEYANSEDYEKIKNWLEEYVDLLDEARDGNQNLIDLTYDLANAEKELEEAEFQMDIAPTVNMINQLNAELELYETLANNAAKAADRFAGEKRLYYLRKQEEYLYRQISLYSALASQSRQLQDFYTTRLESLGIDYFNGSNYADVLNANLENEDLDLITNILEKWQQLESSQLQYQAGIENVTSQLQDLNIEIKKATLQTAVQQFADKTKEATQRVKNLENELDILSIKLQNLEGEERFSYLNEQIDLWGQLQKEQEDALTGLQGQLAVYEAELRRYGFNFDAKGSITNIGSGLSALSDNEDYEYIEDTISLWEELYNTDIPNATQAILEYQNAIQDANKEMEEYYEEQKKELQESYREQLEATEDIEDKITEIYEKALEERKKAIEEETKTLIDELKKQKKAYQDMRKDVEYENDYAEKVSEVEELTRKLEIAKRDASLNNKKNISEIESKLEKAREELSDLVQDRLDDTILDAYDEKMEELEKSSEDMIAQLEEVWSDEKIANMVALSLKTGMFQGIDGEVTDLESKLLSLAESTGELFGVTGQIIKNEWVDNLQTALDTVKNLSTIMSELEVEGFNPANYASATNTVKTGDITISVETNSNASAEDIAEEIKIAINKALTDAMNGL